MPNPDKDFNPFAALQANADKMKPAPTLDQIVDEEPEDESAAKENQCMSVDVSDHVDQWQMPRCPLCDYAIDITDPVVLVHTELFKGLAHEICTHDIEGLICD